jgi:alkaline phosphatase
MRRKLVSTPLLAIALLAMAACAPLQHKGPRNVILFIGDGMGVSTVTAARIHAGQLAGGSGEEHNLSWDVFPSVALVKTYNTDLQVPDSAGTMTAMMTGQKTRAGVLSVSSAAEYGNCVSGLANPLPTLLEQAEQAGYRTGVVSTATITHATPAATYAHSAHRGWEHDAAMPPEAQAQGCRDIARQLIEFAPGDGIEVMLGGGRSHFMPAGTPDPEYPEAQGVRADGRDLVADWLAAGPARSYVWNREQFRALDPVLAGPVLGLFEPGAMQFEADRITAGEDEPSLAEMTGFAIHALQGSEKGFFLMVEGGRIDHAHHRGNAYRALTDTLALDEAVTRALTLTDPTDTLILVTADHSHTLTISGYPRRGNPILGKVVHSSGELLRDPEGRPYTTLGYMNGPGYREELPDLTDVDTTASDYLQVAGYPTSSSETHGGEDVAAFATGLGANRLGGVIEQNLIYDVLYQALFAVPPPR